MSFFAIFWALLLEQARPLGHNNPVHAAMRAWVRWARRTWDAGQPVHAWVTWGLACVGPAVLAALIYVGLDWVSGWLAFAWVVLVLYVTVGFRQFSHHFTAIREALDVGDEERARQALADWQELPVTDLPRQELLRHAIEHAVVAAHRHVFGVMFFFVLGAVLGLGPAGAVVYRMAEYVSRVWSPRHDGVEASAAHEVVQTCWYGLDYWPARVTALGFAVVGNFEEAVAAWRQDAPRFANPNDGVLLAATAGAINVRLGGRALGDAEALAENVASTDGREPQLAHLASVVGLVWRSVVLWMLLLALAWLAKVF